MRPPRQQSSDSSAETGGFPDTHYDVYPDGTPKGLSSSLFHWSDSSSGISDAIQSSTPAASDGQNISSSSKHKRRKKKKRKNRPHPPPAASGGDYGVNHNSDHESSRSYSGISNNRDNSSHSQRDHPHRHRHHLQYKQDERKQGIMSVRGEDDEKHHVSDILQDQLSESGNQKSQQQQPSSTVSSAVAAGGSWLTMTHPHPYPAASAVSTSSSSVSSSESMSSSSNKSLSQHHHAHHHLQSLFQLQDELLEQGTTTTTTSTTSTTTAAPASSITRYQSIPSSSSSSITVPLMSTLSLNPHANAANLDEHPLVTSAHRKHHHSHAPVHHQPEKLLPHSESDRVTATPILREAGREHDHSMHLHRPSLSIQMRDAYCMSEWSLKGRGKLSLNSVSGHSLMITSSMHEDDEDSTPTTTTAASPSSSDVSGARSGRHGGGQGKRIKNKKTKTKKEKEKRRKKTSPALSLRQVMTRLGSVNGSATAAGEAGDGEGGNSYQEFVFIQIAKYKILHGSFVNEMQLNSSSSTTAAAVPAFPPTISTASKSGGSKNSPSPSASLSSPSPSSPSRPIEIMIPNSVMQQFVQLMQQDSNFDHHALKLKEQQQEEERERHQKEQAEQEIENSKRMNKPNTGADPLIPDSVRKSSISSEVNDASVRDPEDQNDDEGGGGDMLDGSKIPVGGDEREESAASAEAAASIRFYIMGFTSDPGHHLAAFLMPWNSRDKEFR
jgi:hypothetical protein